MYVMKKIALVFFAAMVLFGTACSSSSKDETSDTCTENPSAPECVTEGDDGASPAQEGEE